MTLSYSEKIAQLMELTCADNTSGYSQPNRLGDGTTRKRTLTDGSVYYMHGGDYDCSSLVCEILAVLGLIPSNTYMWTGNEDGILRANGFTRIPFSPANVKRGDILWVSGHTGVALGNGKQGDAHGDEYGGITGPNKGDQTTHEIEVRALRTTWTSMYRYAGASGSSTTSSATSKAKTVVNSYTAKDSCNVRKSPSLSGAISGRLSKGDTIAMDGVVVNEGHIWGTYLNYAGERRYLSIGQINSWIKAGA